MKLTCRELTLKVIILLFFILLFSNALALENLEFATKNPYPVCIQEVQAELKKIDLELPVSYFTEQQSAPKLVNQATPCADLISVESKDSGLTALQKFYLESFPKIEQELFAQKFVQQKDYKEKLKQLNEILVNCQKRTEELHKIAAQASDGVYGADGGKEPIYIVPEGYELDTKAINPNNFFEFPDSDVKAYLIYPKDPKMPAIISFAGTRSLTSAAADVNYGASQVNNVKVKFMQWLERVKKRGTTELIITGHSLGGGIAQTLTAMIPDTTDDPYKIQTHLVTFNGFGGLDALKAYESVYGKVTGNNNKDFKKFQPTRDAVGYRIEGDVVSLLGRRFGEVRTIPSPYSSIKIVKNHSMVTLFDEMKKNDHLLAQAKYDNSSVAVRPISFIVQSASTIKSAYNYVTDKLEGLFEKKCELPYVGAIPKDYSDGLDFLTKGDDYHAYLSFGKSCDICHKESCQQYAVLNKIVGMPTRTLRIAKRACDLGDEISCIEAGKIENNEIQDEEKKKNNKYILMGCACGEEPLCKYTGNPDFAKKYIAYKRDVCQDIQSLHSCELFILSKEKLFGHDKNEAKIKRLQFILNQNDAQINAKGPQGFTPLMWAAFNNDFKMVKLLIENGAKVDVKRDNGVVLLDYAYTHKNEDMKKYLIEHGALPRTNPSELKEVIKPGNLVRELDLNERLLNSTKNDDLIKVGQVLDLGANIDTIGPFQQTPLILAAENINLGLVQFLLERGANTNTQDEAGETALHYACFRGQSEMSKYLLDKGAMIDIKNKEGVTPLAYAVKAGNLELVQLLVERGADLNTINLAGNNLLTLAAAGTNLELVKYLVGKGVKVEGNIFKSSNPEVIQYLKNNITNPFDLPK